ncbi:hypothetical protein GN157_14375 [Flavobacterium rakeshii]|uniref:Lipoprotein n=1 Tax=Flavobacterium rakeshii TaxID=1038845 RepID=A0A6N8HGU8_9FLAO|nr:hypothetical protein [Flavobacterium rakeshii]MUV04898.1 hypothetical protein [Flavobacterium rakeshii]
MKKILLIALMASLSLFSCKSMLVKSYGIKDPEFESKEAITEYLIKKDMDTTNVMVFKDLTSYVTAIKRGMKIPNAMFFNSSGNFVNYQKTPEDCNAKVSGFIGDIKAIDSLTEDISFNVFKMTDFLVKPNGDKIEIEKGYDAYVLINWALYAGKLNEEKAFDWVNLLKQNEKDFKVKYYLLNCDFQDMWGLTDEQKKEIGFTVKG